MIELPFKIVFPKPVHKVPEREEMPSSLRDFLGIDDDEDQFPVDSMQIL